ncbi:hypothetical protein CDD81_415 [Ophiocordyceps australis]|uniref:Uncharacterized protein n=1 Tax=Ophiocordyceps australis TaxID=1399860 RepID=A0A2C5Y1U9_9HYPO|nr:hypothetical protein CDD81_415 [Ophiocordyceps australis]
MSYRYGGAKMGMMHAGLAGGYSYSTLTSSMDPPSDGLDARFGRFGRHQSFSAGRPRIDRRYSPPPPRHRPDAGPSSSIYASLQSGLTLPRTAMSKSVPPPHHRDKDKDHQRRAADATWRKTHGDHGRRPAAAAPPPTRPTAKHSDSHNTKTRRESKAGPEGKRHSTQLLQTARPASPRRKSTSTSKKHAHDKHKATSCSGRHSTASSSRTKGAARSVASNKSTPHKSRKPKSKGMFGWGCFGM